MNQCLRQGDKVCLTIVKRHEVDEKIFSTHYDSVIVAGIARVVMDDGEKISAMMKMMQGLAPDMADKAMAHCKTVNRFVMIEVTPAQITGKFRR